MPIQLFLINLVTVCLPVLALTGESMHDGPMDKPPRDANEAIADRPFLRQAIAVVVTKVGLQITSQHMPVFGSSHQSSPLSLAIDTWLLAFALIPAVDRERLKASRFTEVSRRPAQTLSA